RRGFVSVALSSSTIAAARTWRWPRMHRIAGRLQRAVRDRVNLRRAKGGGRARPSRTPTSLTPVPFTNPRSYRLSLSEHAIHDVDSSVEDTEMKRLTDMWHGSRTLLTLLTIAALGAGGPLVAADHDDDGPIATTVFTLSPSTHGNPEGVAFDP